MWQARHANEQTFGDILGLPEQNKFPSILSNHWWYRLTSEGVRPYKVFQTLWYENINGVFSTGMFLSVPKYWESNKILATKVDRNLLYLLINRTIHTGNLNK